MARTFIRQAVQIAESDVYNDAIAPSEANFETNADNIEDDLNSLRSMASELRDVQTGNWYDALSAPSTFEGGAARGVQNVNQDLHDLEKKRILKRNAVVGADVAGGAGQGVILGTGELPNNTTIAIGTVTTLGTVVAEATTFTTFSATDVVTGANALQPKNLVRIIDSATGDPILDGSDREVMGLLQSESSTDGSTASDTTPNRLQISYVVRNATGDGLILAAAGVCNGKTLDYSPVERFYFEGLVEEAFLGDSFGDSGASSVTLQAAYDNQGTTPVDQTTNATLDLEGAGLYWEIRDDAEATLFRVTENSGAGTSTVLIASDVDTFDVDAVDVDFSAGISARTGGSRPIDVGVNDGLVETTAGVLEVKSADDLILNDNNMVSEGTWTGPGVKVSDNTTEVTNYETAFGGEVSLFNALVQAKNSTTRSRVQATMTSSVTANNDVNGPTYHNNCDTDLPPYDQVTFVTDVDVFLNGELLRNNASSGAEDVYPGTDTDEGDLKFTFNLKGTGSKPDQITVIVNGQ